MSNEKTPAFALQFRNRWEEKGGQEMGAIADMTESGNPAVFVRLLLLEDYGRARLEAQRALMCAQWSFARSQTTGALVEVKHFAKTPRFLLSDGLVPDTAEAWINALCITADEETFRLVKAEATAARQEYEAAIKAGTWPEIQYRLANPGHKPSYQVNSLKHDPANEPIRELLRHLGI